MIKFILKIRSVDWINLAPEWKSALELKNMGNLKSVWEKYRGMQ
jgi:hypothetical protein